MSIEIDYPDSLISLTDTTNPAIFSSISNDNVFIQNPDSDMGISADTITITDLTTALPNTATLTSYTLTMADPNNDSTTIVNPLQIVIADGTSGIVNSMTNVNSTLLSGDGFKEVATTPENIILSNNVVTPTTNTLTPENMVFALNGSDRATYGRTGINLSNGALANILQISQDSILLSTAGNSIEITQEDIIVNGLAGTAGQVLQKDSMLWDSPPFGDTATSILDMNNFGIDNVASIDAINATDLNINGQAVFNTPPHIPDPILGNDAASKGYVDTLIGNYSGNGLTLYFNYNTTQTNPIIAPSVGDLQQTLVSVIPPATGNYYTMRSVALGTDTLISTFTTDVGYPNTLTIPTGLWSMLIWGYTTAQTGQLYYHFHLNEVNSAGVFVAQIGTSGFSSDVNAVNSADPDAFHCSLALINPYTMASVSNRLQIQIYTTGTGAVPTYLYTLFGGDYYSNVTTTLNGSTGLLTQNNTWTGVNNFTAGFLTGGVDSAVAGTLNLGTTNSTLTTIGSTANPTAINALNLRININGNTGSAGQVLTAIGTSIAGVAFQNPAFVPTADQALNMGTFGIVGNSMDSAGTLSLGTTNATTTTLGRSGGTTAINGDTIGLTGATSTTITAPTINLTGSVKTANIDCAPLGTLSIGTINPTEMSIGKAGITIKVFGLFQAGNIDRSTAGTLNIAATNATAISFNSKPVSSLTMAQNQYITANTANSSLPTINQLGYVVREAVINSVNTSGTANALSLLATYASIPAGTWLFTISFYVNASGVDSATFQISTSSTAENLWAVTGFSSKPSSGNYGQVSGMITLTASAPVYFLGQSSTATTNITNIRATRTRIA